MNKYDLLRWNVISVVFDYLSLVKRRIYREIQLVLNAFAELFRENLPVEAIECCSV
jgi:hypothetical protein